MPSGLLLPVNMSLTDHRGISMVSVESLLQFLFPLSLKQEIVQIQGCNGVVALTSCPLRVSMLKSVAGDIDLAL